MKLYEDQIYESWLEVVTTSLPGLLKRTVLTKPPTALPIDSSLAQTLQRVESRAGSRPESRVDYSYLLPPGESNAINEFFHIHLLSMGLCDLITRTIIISLSSAPIILVLSCDVWVSFVIALPKNCEYVVNFASQLAEIISETKYLEKLGFEVF